MGKRNPSHSRSRLPLKPARESSIDFISSLPDDILHEILSFIPTKLAIKTSVLSRRWRHVWSQTPGLFFEWVYPSSIDSLIKTLANYSAAKITSFRLKNDATKGLYHHVNSFLIEFAMSRKVEKLSLKFCRNYIMDYNFPYRIFNSCSLKQLTLESQYDSTIPESTTVSWTSLRTLSLIYASLSDESFLKIISGCPMLESLTLKHCQCSFQYLDLSKSLRLTRLDIECRVQEPMQIMAPHIPYLRLRNSEALCTFVDLSSLTEANLDISYYLPWRKSPEADPLTTGCLQVMVQKMLEKLQNVDKLTLGGDFIHILSLSELSGVHLPTLNVKTLILETKLWRSVVPGIARLVQSSPRLKKITIFTTKRSTVLDKYVNCYLESQELNPDQCWRSEVVAFPTMPCDCEVAKPEFAASLMKLLMTKSRTLETLVVYRSGFSGERFLIARNDSNLLVEVK